MVTAHLTLSPLFTTNHNNNRISPIHNLCITTTTTTTTTTSAKPQLFNRRFVSVSCEVALKPDQETLEGNGEELGAEGIMKIGGKIRVRVPLKVYHVPKVPELDITGMEGVIKQYVGVWKGKRISANLPFKVEFVADVEGRGPVKFLAHLKEDEFDFIDE
ncbi:hypothetical protein Syun_028469 [Stephania yunnanensis]|uniref:Ferredoxin thioredoxin reductase alpha chain domain-containing protein n=1 Tax=Stephania yunnanensis TaxID=152371 RepID=A0AAP0EN22_9MAGN